MDMHQGLEDNVSEDVVKLWLVGDDEDAKRAIQWIHDNYSKRVVGYLNSKVGHAISIEEKRSALHDAYGTIWHLARTKELDIDKPLLPFLFSVAYRRLIDNFRARSRKKRVLTDDMYREELERFVGGTKIGTEYRILENRDMAKGVVADFLEWLKSNSLKGRQMEVALCLASGFPEILSSKEVFDILCQKSNKPPTHDAIKRAREVVLGKFRELVVKKYGDLRI